MLLLVYRARWHARQLVGSPDAERLLAHAAAVEKRALAILETEDQTAHVP